MYLILRYEYNEDYYYRGGLIVSTGSNNVFKLMNGQKLILGYGDGSSDTISTPYDFIWISCSQPLSVNVAESELMEFTDLSFNVYTTSITTSGVLIDKVKNNFDEKGFSIDINPTSSGVGSLGLPLSSKTFLLKIKINCKNISENTGKIRITYSTSNDVNKKPVIILNSNITDGYISSNGEYTIYIENPGEGENLEIYSEGKPGTMNL